MELTFTEQIEIVLLDKALIGGCLAAAGFFLSRALEDFKQDRNIQLDKFRAKQSRAMVRFNQEQGRTFEEFKNRLIKQNESQRNVREAVAELAKCLANGVQTICWAAWPARFLAADVTRDHFLAYDKEMAARMGEVVAARVSAAALSPAVHRQLTPFIQSFYALDVRVSEAKGLFMNDSMAGIGALAKLHPISLELENGLLDVVAEINFQDVE